MNLLRRTVGRAFDALDARMEREQYEAMLATTERAHTAMLDVARNAVARRVRDRYGVKVSIGRHTRSATGPFDTVEAIVSLIGPHPTDPQQSAWTGALWCDEPDGVEPIYCDVDPDSGVLSLLGDVDPITAGTVLDGAWDLAQVYAAYADLIRADPPR